MKKLGEVVLRRDSLRFRKVSSGWKRGPKEWVLHELSKLLVPLDDLCEGRPIIRRRTTRPRCLRRHKVRGRLGDVPEGCSPRSLLLAPPPNEGARHDRSLRHSLLMGGEGAGLRDASYSPPSRWARPWDKVAGRCEGLGNLLAGGAEELGLEPVKDGLWAAGDDGLERLVDCASQPLEECSSRWECCSERSARTNLFGLLDIEATF